MIRFSSKLPHNCYEKCPKYGYFSFLALSGGFFQARAPKLMQTFIFWVYSAKKKVASSFRYSNYYSYWPITEFGSKINGTKTITRADEYLKELNAPTTKTWRPLK